MKSLTIKLFDDGVAIDIHPKIDLGYPFCVGDLKNGTFSIYASLSHSLLSSSNLETSLETNLTG